MGFLEDFAAQLLGKQAQDAIAKENTYYNLQSVPDTAASLFQQAGASGKFKPRDVLVGSLVSGLLGGALKGYGDRYQNTLTDRYNQTTNNLLSGNQNNSLDIAPSLFNKAKQDAGLFSIQNKISDYQAKKELADTVGKEYVKQAFTSPSTANRGLESANKFLASQGVAPLMASDTGIPTDSQAYASDPNSPEYKIKQDEFKNTQDTSKLERDLANDFLKQAETFKYKEEGLKALTEAYKDKSGTSDYEIIRRGAQAVEPKLAVRLDDEASLQGAASILGLKLAQVKNAISGESKLDDDVRKGILRIAKRSYNSSLENYNILRNNFLTRAEQAKLNKETIVPFGAGQPFESLYPDLNINATDPTSAIDAALARKGYGPDGKPLATKKGFWE